MSLGTLRRTPQTAIESGAYYLLGPAPTDPMSCVVGQAELLAASALTKLRIVQTPGSAGTDYFFPYSHGSPEGVEVPAAPPEGTIAITTGMNGCALEVVVKDGSYVFYHDRNGNSMNSVNIPGGVGTTVCRVTAESYWDDVWAANQMQMGRAVQYQFLCVFKRSFWHVGCFRFGTDGSGVRVAHGGPGIGPGQDSAYVGYFNETIRLIRRSS